MSTETPTKERSVPKPVFTDAEAGSKEFPSSTSRSFNYFTPAKRRATVYEDVTVDVQPDPERHLTQGWIYGFADGTSGYPHKWTELKSSNWHVFLDPNEEWEQTIYRNNANIVRQVQHNIANAKDAHAFAQWNRPWVDVVAKHVGAWAHAEHGLGMHVYVIANRDAPTNMINNALSVGAVHKLRFAQDVILYNLELDEEIEALRRPGAPRRVERRPDLAEDARERRAADGDPRLGRGLVRHRGACSSRWSASCSAAASSCRRPRCRATSSRRRCSARPSPTPRASSAARAGSSRCSPTTRRTAPRTRRRCRPGCRRGRRSASRPRAPCSRSGPSPQRRRCGSRSRWSARRSASPRCSRDIGLETPKEA